MHLVSGHGPWRWDDVQIGNSQNPRQRGDKLLVLVTIGGEKDALHAVICKTRSESGTGLSSSPPVLEESSSAHATKG